MLSPLASWQLLDWGICVPPLAAELPAVLLPLPSWDVHYHIARAKPPGPLCLRVLTQETGIL